MKCSRHSIGFEWAGFPAKTLSSTNFDTANSKNSLTVPGGQSNWANHDYRRAIPVLPCCSGTCPIRRPPQSHLLEQRARGHWRHISWLRSKHTAAMQNDWPILRFVGPNPTVPYWLPCHGFPWTSALETWEELSQRCRQNPTFCMYDVGEVVIIIYGKRRNSRHGAATALSGTTALQLLTQHSSCRLSDRISTARYWQHLFRSWNGITVFCKCLGLVTLSSARCLLIACSTTTTYMLSRLDYTHKRLFLYVSGQFATSVIVVGLLRTAYVALLVAEEYLCATKFAIRKSEWIYFTAATNHPTPPNPSNNQFSGVSSNIPRLAMDRVDIRRVRPYAKSSSL